MTVCLLADGVILLRQLTLIQLVHKRGEDISVPTRPVEVCVEVPLVLDWSGYDSATPPFLCVDSAGQA